MIACRCFLTLTRLDDPARHREYNAWHQLDHLPENLALPGVLWGDRWVCAPDCAPFVVGEEAAAGYQYAVMYWFRDPVEHAVREWAELNQRAVWWGRRPELAYTHRRPVGYLTPVLAHTAAAALVAADVVPLRPHRGVHLTVSRLAAPGSPPAVSWMARYARELVPALLDLPGVAGVSSYSFHSAGAGFGTASGADDSGVLVRLVHLDGDPVEAMPALRHAAPGWDESSSQEQVLFASPMRAIAPWRWDWFEATDG
ncbi:hypothetical protein [Phytohabitans kaempferiae]|uniref:NIPSNAP domain-containing protein n=1 Tax=Phytohabitans kaempferiae TaxID=1620943 RepID=A0ABV6M319_9ACTN